MSRGLYARDSPVVLASSIFRFDFFGFSDKIVMLPAVSVIVPVYNRAHFLKECIDSIWAQTFKEFEFIVVDDGSEDESPDLLSGYKDRIIVIRQENRGVSAARNAGINRARGTYLAFCDADDLWLPQKLAVQMELFRNDPGAVVCYTDEIWIRNGKRINPCNHHRKFSGDIFIRSLELCLVSPSSVMMHRSFFERTGTFDEELPACEDYDLWLRASLVFPFHFIDKALIVKRGGHADQLSKKYWGMDRFRIKSIVKCLKNRDMSHVQRMEAAKTLQKKCTILANGALKRGEDRKSVV